MKAPLKRAVAIYFSWELFLVQHPKCLQYCIRDARKNVTLMAVAPNLGTKESLGNSLDLSLGNPHVSPCIRVPALHVLCAFFSPPVDSRARASCPTPSITDGLRGEWQVLAWKVLCLYLWGMKGFRFLFPFLVHSPPEWCLESYFYNFVTGCCKPASTTVRYPLWGLGIGSVLWIPFSWQDLRARAEPYRVLNSASLCGSPCPLVFSWGWVYTLIYRVNPPCWLCIDLRGLDKTLLATLSARRLGTPSLPCPAYSFQQKFLWRLKLFIPLAWRAHKVTAPLKFASLSSSVTQNVNVATNKLPLPRLALS